MEYSTPVCTYSHSCAIRIDHRNLLFITEASNPIIARWYMALSEFSFNDIRRISLTSMS